jgi:hypothetical protein
LRGNPGGLEDSSSLQPGPQACSPGRNRPYDMVEALSCPRFPVLMRRGCCEPNLDLAHARQKLSSRVTADMKSITRMLFGRSDASCADIRKGASDYIERDLSPGKLSKVQAHLDWCGPCQAFLETLAATIGMLSRFPRVTPPQSLGRSIMERMIQEDRGRR